MQNLLQMQRGHKAYSDKVLFAEETFAINEGEHVGVIGPNGAGKTTLFRVIVGEESLDSGEMIKSKSLRLGYLAQESDWSLEVLAEDFLKENCSKPLWQLKELGQGLGLSERQFREPLKNLSGGFRMRFQLLFLIGKEPNLMLLDEPTNFLDLESLMALEKFLQSYDGAFLLISHDREFLRRVTDHTLEVEGGDVTKFPGNIDDYFEQKAQLREILERQAANQNLKKKSIEDFVRRFGAKATKAKQAQSRLKRLEKMENIDLKPLAVGARIQVPTPTPTGKEIFSLQNAALGYSGKKILEVKNLSVNRGDHLGIVGFNGVGKSTLIKSLAGVIPFIEGAPRWGKNVQIAAFAQHSAESLFPGHTVLQSLQDKAHPEVKQQEILNMAGSLLFSGDAIRKPISVLSGGEKSRVALGQILLSKANVLLLDEPTNHLDFETVEALTRALVEYEGSLIIVSHDRGFIGRISTKILEIHDGRLELYPGTYDDYCWSLEKGALSTRARPTSPGDILDTKTAEPPMFTAKINLKEERKRLESELLICRRKMKGIESKLHADQACRQQIMEGLMNASGEKAVELSKALSNISEIIENAENELFSCLEHETNLAKALGGLSGN